MLKTMKALIEVIIEWLCIDPISYGWWGFIFKLNMKPILSDIGRV